MMQNVAEQAGELIATVPLQHFGGRNIQDLVTWTDQSEALARDLMKKLLSKQTPSHLPFLFLSLHVFSFPLSLSLSGSLTEHKHKHNNQYKNAK